MKRSTVLFPAWDYGLGTHEHFSLFCLLQSLPTSDVAAEMYLLAVEVSTILSTEYFVLSSLSFILFNLFVICLSVL